MGDRSPGEEVVAECIDDEVVCVPDVHVLERPGIPGEAPAGVDRAEDLKPFLEADEIVVPPVPGSDVDETGVFERDVIGRDDPVPDLGLVRHLAGERRRVLRPDEIAAAGLLEDGVVLVAPHLQDGFDELVGDPEDLLVVVLLCRHPGVGERGADRHRDVCGKRPRRGRPDHQVLVLAPGNRELDEDRRVGLVPVLHLRVGDRRLAPGAPVHDTVAAFEKSALFRPLDCPPCRLDILRLDRLVGVIEVEPDTEFPELVAHDLHVRHGERPALFDERGDPVLLDIFFGGEPELVLDLHLNGEAVHIVAGPLDDIPPLHSVVAEDGVFYDLVPGGAEMDVAGGIRRPVDEKERFSIPSQFLGACIGVFLSPVILDSRFDLARAITVGDFLHLISLIFSTLEYRLLSGDKVFCARDRREDRGESMAGCGLQTMCGSEKGGSPRKSR